jgi:hypothetical protein
LELTIARFTLLRKKEKEAEKNKVEWIGREEEQKEKGEVVVLIAVVVFVVELVVLRVVV